MESHKHELQVYQELIDRKAEENSGEILPNAGKEHAAIVMAKMLEKTRESVKMIVGSFSGEVSNQENYRVALERCLKDGVQFDIMFLEKPNESSLAFRTLLQYPKQFHYKIASKKIKEKFQDTHFAVFDDNKYRFETDTQKYLAWVCFNDTNTSSTLLDIFKELYK